MVVITMHLSVLFKCCLSWGLNKGHYIFFSFLEFASFMLSFGSLSLSIMVQIQNSNFELCRQHLCAAAKMSHGRFDPTLLAFIRKAITATVALEVHFILPITYPPRSQEESLLPLSPFLSKWVILRVVFVCPSLLIFGQDFLRILVKCRNHGPAST